VLFILILINKQNTHSDSAGSCAVFKTVPATSLPYILASMLKRSTSYSRSESRSLFQFYFLPFICLDRF